MTTESTKPAPYDRPALFKLAWEYARYTSTLVEIPAHKLIGSAIWAVWRMEKTKREALLMQRKIEQSRNRIDALLEEISRVSAQKRA